MTVMTVIRLRVGRGGERRGARGRRDGDRRRRLEKMRIMTRRPATRLYGRFWSVFLASTTCFSKGSVLLASTSRFSSLYRTFKQRDGPWLLYTVLKEKRESVSDSVQVRRTLNALAQSMTPRRTIQSQSALSARDFIYYLCEWSLKDKRRVPPAGTTKAMQCSQQQGRPSSRPRPPPPAPP